MSLIHRISILEVSLFAVSLTANVANAGVLGFEGPLVADEQGNWSKYRVTEPSEIQTALEIDKACKIRTTQNLRDLFFEHFRFYVDHSKRKITDVEIARFSKVLGMAPYESSGASAAVTDMKRRGSRETLVYFRADNPRNEPGDVPGMHSSIESLDKLMGLKNVKFDKQTNFGLLQMSADRLATNHNGFGALARKMITDMRALYVTHPEEVIDRCGTRHMFRDEDHEIRKAFDEIQSCQVGYNEKDEVQCFGRWAALCPNYNITLALVATPRYFATKHKAPLCVKTFRRMLRGAQAARDVSTPKIRVKKSTKKKSTKKPAAPTAARPAAASPMTEQRLPSATPTGVAL